MKIETIIKVIISMALLASLAAVIYAGWLTNTSDADDDVILGDVEVEVEAYFEYYDEFDVLQTKTTGIEYVAEVEGQSPFTKTGVYKVNLATPTDAQFLENFRVNIKVYSSVDTYFRIAPYEQVTLTYVANGKTVEVATTQAGYMPFNYNSTGVFHDNRVNDGFFYYKNTVKRINETTPTVISLIGTYFENESFATYEPRYSLQIGFIIEAVQAIDGPQINWNLPMTPWDTEW